MNIKIGFMCNTELNHILVTNYILQLVDCNDAEKVACSHKIKQTYLLGYLLIVSVD